MDGHRHNPYNMDPLPAEEPNTVSIEQLQQLVRLLDRSDVSELELKRAEEGIRLVLRKVQIFENGDQRSITSTDIDASLATPIVSAAPPQQTTHTVVASLVGIFRTWSKPRGKALVSIGDRVKVGQHIAAIESLNVINEVESPVTGRIIELLVQEGQPIEYGQPLITIDSTGEA